MKCSHILSLLSEYSRDELGPQAHQEVALHLEQCQACAQAERLHHQLSQLLVLNPPEAPQSLAFAMMPNRLWEELAARRKKRFAWFGFLGFAASAALVALVFLWPGATEEKLKRGLPDFTADEIAVAEEALSPGDNPLAALFEPIDLSGLDEEGAVVLSQRLAQVLPEPEVDPLEGEEGGYLEELDSLSPEELDRLDQLLEAKKKG
jgi:anti-sigma factor RsiW